MSLSFDELRKMASAISNLMDALEESEKYAAHDPMAFVVMDRLSHIGGEVMDLAAVISDMEEEAV